MKWLKILCAIILFFVVLILSTALTIRLSLKDAPTVACPDVVGLDYEEAKRVGEAAGLSVVCVRWEKKKDMPYNRVLMQMPDPSVSVREGRTISVVLSDGPKPTTIPQLVGLSVEEAQGELAARGMPVKKILYVPNDAMGQVIAQSPAGGEGILWEGGMVLVAGGREKRFFVMPQISVNDLVPVVEELDRKRIRYELVPAGFPAVAGNGGSTVKVVPRIIFNDDTTIELPASSSGGGL